MKKVLLIIVDALSSRVVEPALTEDRLPNLRMLRDAAEVQTDSISIFPSITPAATSSLVTGTYPCEHGVSGANWYISEEKTVVYFGYDVWAILEEGVGTYAQDFLMNLNEKHLKADTVFQMVEDNGLQAASLNYLVYHGDNAHSLQLPGPLDTVRDAVANLLLDDGTEPVVNGPKLQYFGDIIKTELPGDGYLSAPGGPSNRFGIQDKTTAVLLKELIRKDAMYDFTIAYFPDNDFRSHQVGPEDAVEKLKELDDELGEIYSLFGGLERMLDEVCIVLTGDHAQCNVLEKSRNPGIQLQEVLSSFSIADPGTPMDEENDLVACPNLRSVQFYFHSPTHNRLRRITQGLLNDDRVDQVLWNEELVGGDPDSYWIATKNRGRLHFWPGDSGADSAKDSYGNTWSWDGDLRTVDAQVKEGELVFGDYPNAFERIAGVLKLDVAGHLWATSFPGYEFQLKTTKVHIGGGSHGSLHVLDSVSPLWVAGGGEHQALTKPARSVDIVPICLEVLGIA